MVQDGNREWHYARQSHAVGPNSAQEMLVLLRAGVVNRETLLWHAKHSPEWSPLEAHLELLQSQAAIATRPRSRSHKPAPVALIAAAALIALVALTIVWLL